MLLYSSLMQARRSADLRSEGAASVALADSAPKIGANWKAPAPVRTRQPVRRSLVRVILGSM